MFAWKMPENMPNLADRVRKYLRWNWHSSSQQNEPDQSDERSTQPLPTEKLEMPGEATHPSGTPSPTSPESPPGLDLKNGSGPFISTQNFSSASCYVEVKESLSHPHEGSPDINSPLNPSENETSKGANAGISLLGRSKDPQEHQTVPDGPDTAHIAKILSANNKLLALQNKVALKRSEVQERRTALRFKREEEADIRAQFIRHVTVAQGTPTSIQSLLQNNEALLDATGIYSDMEAEYNNAESELERDEYTLTTAMEDFARLSHGHHSLPTPNEPPLSDHDGFSDVRSTTSSTSEDPSDVVDYISCVTDVRMIQERLSELDREWLFIQEKKEERESLNIPMDDESMEFLRSYEAERREICDELFHMQQNMNQLRTVCFEKGHLTQECIRGRDFVYELYPAAPPNQPEDPLKASVEEDMSPFDPIEENVSQNKFVNKWLLHRLRQSSVEIGQLKSLPEIKSLCDQGYDEQKVSQLSLNQWFEDEATVSPPPPPITSDMSVQEPGSVRDTVSGSHSI
ncbi:hypothetical protein ANOM_000260 [Aspergillus nomiae NRRL 13137]|uniref:Uncharacterized protein n=1 Tax=Aspergillus nomiae NRRL (strain ATCC 15546 / NRRL 13137 / CBS 260.88 / M93) TaxID=1509407 RepID=A0A0L1JIT1_ASPN3|nr:uncharacterized protein ANOM_000260 [Aspergillus nomiae NRRL 13137]KNG91612.1 hypothetical protein ANOM_000260 [Aspergillus nomiae NRRL 13137]